MAKIKMCGMTNLDDCRAAIDLGVDFIGFVFYKESRRYVTPERVRDITEKIDSRARTVGVFVKENEGEIDQVMKFCHLDFAQTYGKRAKDNRICVYRINDSVPAVDPVGFVLFDSYSTGFGGSARSFDIGLLRGHSSLPRAFIAGGIGEHNVYTALSLNPFGVDLVSSIEKEKGMKDFKKMETLVNMVRSYRT